MLNTEIGVNMIWQKSIFIITLIYFSMGLSCRGKMRTEPNK